MYTAAPVRGADPLLVSRTVSLTVSGTPSATPEDVPKLLVRSLRTMPLSVSTLTPLDPSPGNGPPVSSGICVPAAEAEDAEAAGVAADVEDVVAAEPLDEGLQAASVAAIPA